MSEAVRKLCVIGVGLIGGSFARALRERSLVQEVVGVGRSRPNLEEAKRLGVVDSFTDDPVEAAKGADLIFLATPVRAIPGIVKTLRPVLTSRTILTDAGSTKESLVRAVGKLLPPEIPFVAGHPIAGKEKTGAAAGSADLFVKRWTILTPTRRTIPQALARVRELWEQCGAKVETMTPRDHDQVLAGVSHLPHLVAYALVEALLRWDKKQPVLQYSAGGLKDFTRIAGSSPEMWRDICLENREAILEAMDRYASAYFKLRWLIDSRDAEALEQWFVESKKGRERIEEGNRG